MIGVLLWTKKYALHIHVLDSVMALASSRCMQGVILIYTSMTARLYSAAVLAGLPDWRKQSVTCTKSGQLASAYPPALTTSLV